MQYRSFNAEELKAGSDRESPFFRFCLLNYLLRMISEGEILCCLSAAGLYLTGRSYARDADELNSVTRVNQLSDLGNVLPLVVTVSGRVGSDQPIHCENSGLQVVVLRRKIELHYEKKNDAGSWVKDSALMLSRCREVNWYLDDGTSRVYVVGATGLVPTVISDVFEESGRPLMHGKLDNIPGLKMRRIREVECVLPTGTPLMVVGEAVKDDIGSIQIQRPRDGPFYVTDQTIDQLISNLREQSRFFTYASMGFTVLGALFLAKHAIQHILERSRP